MKTFIFLSLVLGLSSAPVFSATMNFSGSFRTEATSFTGLGQTSGKGGKQYLLGRALIDPNLLVDDRFSIRSQWSLLTSPRFTPDATQPLGNGQGGFVFGDVQSASLNLNRVWMEWTSDFGVVRLGRVPISWGYGLTWDAGNGIWDDYQTTDDRLEYRLHLGNVIGALAYTKARKLSVLEGSDDQDFYTAYLQYDNPELDVEGGIYFEKQARSSGLDAMTGTPTSVPAPSNPLAPTIESPYPKNNNAIDVYLKKTTGRFTYGGEVTWISGKAYDLGGDGTEDDLSAFGAMGSITYAYHKFKAFTEVVYASGDKDTKDNTATGYSLLHLNRARPGLILGRELIGQFHSTNGNTVSQGNLLVYGQGDNFSGLLFIRPGVRIDWSPTWASGVEVIFAKKATVQEGENANLGWEIDLGTDYNIYRNFNLGINAGFAFPGEGIEIPSGGERKMIFAVRTTAALKF